MNNSSTRSVDAGTKSFGERTLPRKGKARGGDTGKTIDELVKRTTTGESPRHRPDNDPDALTKAKARLPRL
jgi:hypothetical protein